MEANIITLFRICLVLVAVGLFEVGSVYGNAIATHPCGSCPLSGCL